MVILLVVVSEIVEYINTKMIRYARLMTKNEEHEALAANTFTFMCINIILAPFILCFRVGSVAFANMMLTPFWWMDDDEIYNYASDFER